MISDLESKLHYENAKASLMKAYLDDLPELRRYFDVFIAASDNYPARFGETKYG
jgi:hypothetical protein